MVFLQPGRLSPVLIIGIVKTSVHIKKLVWLLLLALAYLLPVVTTIPAAAGGAGAHAVVVASEDDGVFESHWDNGWPAQRVPDEAARINQRYHQQLQAFLSADVTFPPDHHLPFRLSELRKSPAVYNSSCLSSCYDYIFRLCPF